jgi:hypothetical protein
MEEARNEEQFATPDLHSSPIAVCQRRLVNQNPPTHTHSSFWATLIPKYPTMQKMGNEAEMETEDAKTPAPFPGHILFCISISRVCHRNPRSPHMHTRGIRNRVRLQGERGASECENSSNTSSCTAQSLPLCESHHSRLPLSGTIP